MQILKNRIVELSKYITHIEDGESFYIVTSIQDAQQRNLVKVGAFNGWQNYLSILPAQIGPKTKFNKMGKYIALKDQPKELYTYFVKPKYYPNGTYRKGYYRTISRYQRGKINPPNSHIVCNEISGDKFVVSQQHIKTVENYELIKHEINLFLEIFGNCQIVKNLLDVHNQSNIEYVDWEILPKGEYPWLRNQLAAKRYYKKSLDKQQAIKDRHDYVEKYNPDKVYIGADSFSNYYVFAFLQKNLYILESSEDGNATYIFNESSEEFSKLTKSELINNNLFTHRFIHNETWYENIDTILK